MPHPGGLPAGRFLPAEGCEATTFPHLSPEGCTLNRSMLACLATLRAVLAALPVGTLALRQGPAHNLAHPQGGPLFRENFPWGMTGDRSRHTAAAAPHEPGLGAAP